jgi:YVTN family beta-propeller protein
MTAITIKDLHINRELDGKAMSRITGARSANWLYGWARAYAGDAQGSGYGGNFYQTNYFYIADQMNNQISVIDVQNSAANAVINVDAKQQAGNIKGAGA